MLEHSRIIVLRCQQDSPTKTWKTSNLLPELMTISMTKSKVSRDRGLHCLVVYQKMALHLIFSLLQLLQLLMMTMRLQQKAIPNNQQLSQLQVQLSMPQMTSEKNSSLCSYLTAKSRTILTLTKFSIATLTRSLTNLMKQILVLVRSPKIETSPSKTLLWLMKRSSENGNSLLAIMNLIT